MRGKQVSRNRVRARPGMNADLAGCMYERHTADIIEPGHLLPIVAAALAPPRHVALRFPEGNRHAVLGETPRWQGIAIQDTFAVSVLERQHMRTAGPRETEV